MANKLNNLMPIEEVNSNRTREQHSEDSRKGGIASGKARREKATMRKTLEKMLDETYKNTGMTYRDMATLGLIKGAVKGNAQNYKTIMEVLGELIVQTDLTETPSVTVNIVDNSNLEKAMYEED